jgi:hypothetical protein
MYGAKKKPSKNRELFLEISFRGNYFFTVVSLTVVSFTVVSFTVESFATESVLATESFAVESPVVVEDEPLQAAKEAAIAKAKKPNLKFFIFNFLNK